jgi:hypothetical protein
LDNKRSKHDKTTSKGPTISKRKPYNTFVTTSNRQLTSKRRRGGGFKVPRKQNEKITTKDYNQQNKKILQSVRQRTTQLQSKP